MKQIRADIRDFKAANGLDKVVVLWTANTERFAAIEEVGGQRDGAGLFGCFLVAWFDYIYF